MAIIKACVVVLNILWFFPLFGIAGCLAEGWFNHQPASTWPISSLSASQAPQIWRLEKSSLQPAQVRGERVSQAGAYYIPMRVFLKMGGHPQIIH